MLEPCMDCGLPEADFWDMTIAELVRFVESFNRRKEREAKETASYLYILADLIGVSVSRIHSKQARFPSIEEVFPQLFKEEEEQKATNQDALSAIRFRQFAQAFNQNFKKGGKEDDRRT